MREEEQVLHIVPMRLTLLQCTTYLTRINVLC